MPVVFFRHLGGNFAYIHAVDTVDPGFGGGIGVGVDPGFGIGEGAHPGHGLPHPPHFPSNSLPPGPPPHVPPGNVVVLVRDPAGVWHYAMMPANAAPPPMPDNTLPGGPPNMATNPIAPGAAPKR